MSQISQIKKIYHAAIYVRLSKEDGAVASHEKTESNSIANQKSLIRDFLENKNDIEVVQEYVDDGFSGSNFERQAFQMMLEDIKKGKIDCVVTKDLSRFGREYIDSGMYIERLFPAMGVRFIAINDGIDSGEAKSQSDEIIIPFKNLINDAYCRDISIKIRSHLEIKRKQGDVITAFVPYGYKKNDKDKHKLEIDVYAANVVKDIFRMKLHGKSQDAIACELNSSGILPPAEYKASTGSNYQTCFKTKEKSEWTSVMVRRILTNEVYIGNLVQGKQTTPNHKVKKTIIKEKCEWIRIEKNHEPVITDRDFEVVQRLLAMDTRTSPDREEVYPLSGVVTCGGCGIPMVRKTSKVGGKTYAYYLCATHKDSKQCSSHRISTDKLEEVVLELLQTHIDNMIDLKRILSFIGNVPFQQLDMKKLEERREKKQAEVDRCADLRGMLYEDMKDGIISKEDYKELHTAYEQRKKSAEIAIHQIELEMEDVLNRKSKGFVWLDYFTEHKNIEKLTREVVVSLIREIKVFDKTHIEVMLLGKKESSFYFDGFVPRITWTLYNADKSVKAYEHFDMPLLLAVDKVYGKIRNEKYRYIADQTTLFPEEVDQYNPNLVKEIINNCIAHSDYRLRGKINLEEYEDHLVFINEGAFIPETVEQALEPGYKPPYYRNAFLCNAMVNMYMIDTNSMGIPMIYEIQKGKCFPLPTFDLDTPNRVVVTVYGKVLDPNYTRLLHANDDLDLRTVFLLDQVQKKKTISKEDFSQLKSRNLVEGRYPNIFVSYKVAKVVGDKANYVRQKGLDEEVCMHFILSTLKLGPAKKSDLLAVLKDVLPDVLTDQQKSRKLSNLLQKMKKNGIIDVRGIAINSEWYLLTKD